MAKKKNMVIGILIFTFCLFSASLNRTVSAASEDEVITQGVYIDSVPIGGMTKSEAENAVKNYVDALKDKKITVTIDNKEESTTLDKLGFESKDNDYIDEALMVGKTGNLIHRYKELKDTEKTNLVYTMEFKLDNDKVKKFVEDKCSAYDVKAENATVKRSGGKFVYTDDTIGHKVDVKETMNAMKAAVTENLQEQEITIAATIVEDKPEYTREMVEKVKDLLGSYSTTYTTSSADRAGNLANGARLINNTVLYPGDVFSAYKKLTPFTTANGYFQAGAYANGKVIDSIGGGACQVTTTLYNAVLFSELEVVERANHSMTISYVDLSRDAAIAGTWKDLKFKNDTKSPILIEAYTQGRTITFNIWGDETRDTKKRKIKFETVVLDQRAPGADVVTKDPTKPKTYMFTTQSAHTGYAAELYKIIYEDGVEVSRTRVNKSVYNASPRYITVGTKEEEKEKPDDTKDSVEEDGKDTGKSQAGNSGKKGDKTDVIKGGDDSVPVTNPDAGDTDEDETIEDSGNTIEDVE